MSGSQAGSEELRGIARRLNVLIRFELDKQKTSNSEVTVGDQINYLESAGLAGKDAADILGLDVGQLASYRRYSKKVRSIKKKGETPT
jgi:hypothetical protein